MKIGLIGCGRVGLTIGYFLKRRNLLFGVYDKDKNALIRALKRLRIKKNPDYKDLIKNSNILLFATPDDEILNAYNEAKKYIIDKKYLYHFSGLLPAEIFPRKKNIHCASIHPFATFPQVMIPPRKKRFILFFQGDGESLKVARTFFTKQNFLIRTIDKKQKTLYHLLGVFSSNFVVSLSAAIKRIIKKLKWDDKEFEKTVLPMILDSLTNVTKYGVKMGLSGPVIRGDVKTVKKHLKTLKQNPELYDTYRSQSRLIIKYAPEQNKRLLKKILQIR